MYKLAPPAPGKPSASFKTRRLPASPLTLQGRAVDALSVDVVDVRGPPRVWLAPSTEHYCCGLWLTTATPGTMALSRLRAVGWLSATAVGQEHALLGSPSTGSVADWRRVADSGAVWLTLAQSG